MQAAHTIESGPLARRRRIFLAGIGAPALFYVAAVGLLPLAIGLRDSFSDLNLMRPGPPRSVGLRNYTDLFDDPSAHAALVNTLRFTLAAVLIEFVLGFALAWLLRPDTRFHRVLLALVLIPVTLTPMAVGLLFRALLEPDIGLLGWSAARLGLSGRSGFFADESTALAALVAIDVWEWTPLMALILLAGLKGLPGDVLEAAEVDGAGPVQLFRRVVLPLMIPSIILALVMRTMDAFKIYDSVFAITGGGPNDATLTLMFHAAKQGLELFDIGAASAVSTFMLATIGTLTAVFVAISRRVERGYRT